MSYARLNLANRYNRLNKMLHAPEHYGKVTNWPIRSGDWNMDQFGKICYRDSIELTVDGDNVTVDKKPLLMLNSTAIKKADETVQYLSNVYSNHLSANEENTNDFITNYIRRTRTWYNERFFQLLRKVGY